MHKLYKGMTALALVAAFAIPLFAFSLAAVPAVNAATAVPSTDNILDPWGGGSTDITEDKLQGITGLGAKDPRAIAAGVINVVLGFLGIVAVVIILIGGFKWMTAAGNEDKVEEAKKLISAGIIGLIIILAAFGIAKFVIDSLLKATTTA